MKSTGIVRKIDGLGRVVLPIELRRLMNLEDNASLEIFVDGDEIVLKSTSPPASSAARPRAWWPLRGATSAPPAARRSAACKAAGLSPQEKQKTAPRPRDAGRGLFLFCAAGLFNAPGRCGSRCS